MADRSLPQRNRLTPAGVAPAVRPMRAAPAFVAAALAMALVSPHARATTYKWVDDKGVTHYTDKIPPEAVNKGRTELDKQARPVKKVDPAPTAEQLRAKQAEAERQEALAREQEVALRRDRALMLSYTTEAEIDLARSRVLATIDAQLQAAQSFSQTLTKRENELSAKKSAASDRALPPAEERELEGIRNELGRQKALIALKRRERDAATAKYDADKSRWRDLRAVADAEASAVDRIPPSGTTSGTPQANVAKPPSVTERK